MMKIAQTAALLFLVLILFYQCFEGRKPAPQNENTLIVCTTGMVADAVSNIVKERADVISLMGAGVDPHLYKASQGDLEKLMKADMVVFNGLHLEGKMQEVLEKLANKKPVYALTSELPADDLLASLDYSDANDPHIWFDTGLWSKAVSNTAGFLAVHDPDNSDFYMQNGKSYSTKLNKIHKLNQHRFATLPKNSRVLVTSHDAFRYFGRAYGLEVRALQGLSTASEFGLKDVKDLVDFIVKRRIKAVFVESSVPRKPLEAVVEGCKKKGHKLQIGGELFSDAMGEAGTKSGTYTGMIDHNTELIINALK